jgi:hypothetical protein
VPGLVYFRENNDDRQNLDLLTARQRDELRQAIELIRGSSLEPSSAVPAYRRIRPRNTANLSRKSLTLGCSPGHQTRVGKYLNDPAVVAAGALAGSRSAALSTAPPARACAGVSRRDPRLSGPLFDVTPDQAPYHLRRRSVLVRTQAFKHRLLTRINQDGEPCGAIFENQGADYRHL